MEQSKSVQLFSPDCMLEKIEAMGTTELGLLLNGIARASGAEAVINPDQPRDEALVRTPFGDQLMTELEYADNANKPPAPPSTYKEPAPTFSPNDKGNQTFDDGGTGPGADE